MLDINDLNNIIKKSAIEAIQASKPTELVFGKVKYISPLTVNIENKLNLTNAQLILTRNVTDYTIQMTIEGVKKYITVHNSLAIGDEVTLVRMQGGQKYIVLDRVVTI